MGGGSDRTLVCGHPSHRSWFEYESASKYHEKMILMIVVLREKEEDRERRPEEPLTPSF